jgi:hypothetical protein
MHYLESPTVLWRGIPDPPNVTLPRGALRSCGARIRREVTVTLATRRGVTFDKLWILNFHMLPQVSAATAQRASGYSRVHRTAS